MPAPAAALRVAVSLFATVEAGGDLREVLAAAGLKRLPPSAFARWQRECGSRSLPPLRLALVAGTLALVVVGARSERERALALVAAACFAAGAVTVVRRARPAERVMGGWNPEHPPLDWREVRDRWFAAQFIRTGGDAVALVCLALATEAGAQAL